MDCGLLTCQIQICVTFTCEAQKKIVYSKKSERTKERQKEKAFQDVPSLFSPVQLWYEMNSVYQLGHMSVSWAKPFPAHCLKIILKNLIPTAAQWTKTCQPELTAHWNRGREWPVICGRQNDYLTLLFLSQQQCSVLKNSNSWHLFTYMLYKTKLAISYKQRLHLTTIRQKLIAFAMLYSALNWPGVIRKKITKLSFG